MLDFRKIEFNIIGAIGCFFIMGVVYLYPVAIKNRKVLHPPFERRLENG